MSAVELADVTGMHAPSLRRLMRTLASLGVLTERDKQQFALTSLGEALKTGAEGSARFTLLYLAGESAWRSWGEIIHSLETGETGFDKAFGMPVFEYLSKNPEEAAYFGEALVGFHGAEPLAVALPTTFRK